MKKYVGLVVLIFFIGVTTYAQTSTGTYISAIKQRGYLRVAMLANDQYPFFYTDSQGQFTGIDVTIAKTIANNLGVTLEINREAESFNALIPLLLAKKVDLVISKLSKTVSRSATVIFSEPYAVFNQALLLNRVQLAKVANGDKNTALFVQSFSGRIGVIKNSSYQRYAGINFVNAEIVEFDTWDDAKDAVVNGTILGIYRDELEIQKVLVDSPQTSIFLKPVIITDREDPIAIAMEPYEYHLAYYINLLLENMDIPESASEMLDEYKR